MILPENAARTIINAIIIKARVLGFIN